MCFDIKNIYSHPDKYLLDHTGGVRKNVKELTSSRIADLIAIFHDLGKVNPNFRENLVLQNSNGYTHHAYLSGYAFFCFFSNSSNLALLKQFLEVDSLTRNDLIALTVLIAKHHSDLPDFYPESYRNEPNISILSQDENKSLYKFLDDYKDLCLFEYIKSFFPNIIDSSFMLFHKCVQQGYLEKFIYKSTDNKSPLTFFLDHQFAFACLLQADKADAANFSDFIKGQKQDVHDFSEIFISKLQLYLDGLKQDSELNKLRTRIRKEAVLNIQESLATDERIFELTAPTGSGKTLMMLSLASEIMKWKGAKRIIYALPFLSITEQVEIEMLNIFAENECYIQRIDSKSENKRFEELQKELDKEVTKERLLEVSLLAFQEKTFSYPLVITTFVQFFETLLSNKNAELLKLPNFSNCIFLIDEIQALPPRLYGFFVAYLQAFCKRFNSYAIISTATQPNFELPENNKSAKLFFPDYTSPTPLLPLSYFENDLFNRYNIFISEDPVNCSLLAHKILAHNQSVLIILNTIDDTKELYDLLAEVIDTGELLLLNTHMTPRDRKTKISLAKQCLSEKKKVIMISTQLIEAGVDIDFPVLYRDFATVTSVIQSAGRCNRNGKLVNKGVVILFHLYKNGKQRSKLIYQGKDKPLFGYTQNAFRLKNEYQEKELISVQKEFFKKIREELLFACHSQDSPKLEFNLLEDIPKCMFNKIGKFRLIDKQLYGEEKRFYVPVNEQDVEFERLLSLDEEFWELIKNNGTEITEIMKKKKDIELQLKRMSNQIIQVRFKKEDSYPLLGNPKMYYNLSKIDKEFYSFEKGVVLPVVFIL